MQSRTRYLAIIAATSTGCTTTVYEQVEAGGNSATIPLSSGGSLTTGGVASTGGNGSLAGAASTGSGSSLGGNATGGGIGVGSSYGGNTAAVGGLSGLGGTLATVAGGSTPTTGGTGTLDSTTTSASGSTNSGGGVASTGGTAAATSIQGGTTAPVTTVPTQGGTGTSTGGALATGGNPSGGTTTNISGCASQVVDVRLPQLNFVFLLDRSASMGDQKNGSDYDWQHCASRWNPVTQAVKSFINDTDSSGLYASLSFMPADGDEYAMCTAANYSSGSASMKVPLTALDDAGRQQFMSKLCDCGGGTTPTPGCVVPSGGHPTLTALQGTIDYANSVRGSNTDGKTIIVFLTDGEPGFGYFYDISVFHLNSCDDLAPKGCGAGSCGCVDNSSKCTTSDAEIAKVAAIIQSVPTRSMYVAGMGEVSNATLNVWAMASGNDAINLFEVNGSQVQAGLLAELRTIRDSGVQCAFDAPQPTSSTTVDKDQTNVAYITGSGVSQGLVRTHDGTGNSCGTSTTSWYFDNPSTPKQIKLCPAACAAVGHDAKAQLQVLYGCQVLVG